MLLLTDMVPFHSRVHGGVSAAIALTVTHLKTAVGWN